MDRFDKVIQQNFIQLLHYIPTSFLKICFLESDSNLYVNAPQWGKIILTSTLTVKFDISYPESVS